MRRQFFFPRGGGNNGNLLSTNRGSDKDIVREKDFRDKAMGRLMNSG